MRISDWSSDVCSSDLGRKQLFAIGDAVFLAHVFKAGRLPGFVARLDDERGHPGLELIGVRLEPAMFGLHESEGERIEGLFRAQPYKAAFARVDIGLVGLGIARAHPRSEEHTCELQSLMRISYAVFCLKKKTNKQRE